MARTILLVEDNEQAQALIASVLVRHGYRVFQARDSAEAFAHWTEPGRSFDLLLSDVRLEEQDDGFMLAQKLLDIHPGVPVIFISGDRDCFASPAIAQFGDSPFLPKPFDVNKMLSAVEKVMGGSHPQQP